MEVVFYQSDGGRSPVTKFIDEQPLHDQAAIIAVLDAIERDGLNAKGASYRQIDGKLWEIKIKAPSGGYRVFYVLLSGGVMMLLHAFKKKTQRAPLKDLAVAKKRLAEVT
jgi:phage-related protein